MPAGAFTAARSIEISDEEIASGEGFQHFKALALASGQQFTPQAVHVNQSNDQTEEGAGYASIDGYLVGESNTKRRVWRVVTRMPVGLAFACVYNTANTTARGITLLEEV